MLFNIMNHFLVNLMQYDPGNIKFLEPVKNPIWYQEPKVVARLQDVIQVSWSRRSRNREGRHQDVGEDSAQSRTNVHGHQTKLMDCLLWFLLKRDNKQEGRKQYCRTLWDCWNATQREEKETLDVERSVEARVAQKKKTLWNRLKTRYKV